MRKMKKWTDMAGHRPGCPHKGIAVYGTDEEMAKYYSGYCPGCSVPVKWEREKQDPLHPADNRPAAEICAGAPQ